LLTENANNQADVDEIVVMSFGQRCAACVLILFMAYTGIFMACPWPKVASNLQYMLDPVLPVLYNLGLDHRLRLFAPAPPLYTGRLEFRVTRPDGSVGSWEYPREELAPSDPPGSYNRYLFLYLIWDFRNKMSAMGPSLGRYVADQVEAAEGQRPTTVELVERVVDIPPPQAGIGHPSPEPNRTLICLKYDVASDKVQLFGWPTAW
jgi:hypothetical protein